MVRSVMFFLRGFVLLGALAPLTCWASGQLALSAVPQESAPQAVPQAAPQAVPQVVPQSVAPRAIVPEVAQYSFYKAHVELRSPPSPGVTTYGGLTIIDNATGHFLGAGDLEKVRGSLVRLHFVDAKLTEYKQSTASTTANKGLWRFEFTPDGPGPYVMWAEVVLKGTNIPMYERAELGGSVARDIAPVDKSYDAEGAAVGRRLLLTFDTPPKVGQVAVARIEIKDVTNKDAVDLAPFQGVFAHAVGLSEDVQSIYPMFFTGDTPKGDADRYGSDLEFRFIPPKAGYNRMFLTVNMMNRMVVVPLGFDVAP